MINIAKNTMLTVTGTLKVNVKKRIRIRSFFITSGSGSGSLKKGPDPTGSGSVSGSGSSTLIISCTNVHFECALGWVDFRFVLEIQIVVVTGDSAKNASESEKFWKTYFVK